MVKSHLFKQLFVFLLKEWRTKTVIVALYSTLQWLFPGSIAPSPTSSQNWMRGNERSSTGENIFLTFLIIKKKSKLFPSKVVSCSCCMVDSFLDVCSPPAHVFIFVVSLPQPFIFVFLHWKMSPSARLKKIQEKKKQLRERTELEIAARLAKLGPIAEPANMLTEETDEDLLFEWSTLNRSHRLHPSSYLLCASQATSMSSHASEESCFCVLFCDDLFCCSSAERYCVFGALWRGQSGATLGRYPPQVSRFTMIK